MIVIRNANTVRDRLLWAIAEEEQLGIPRGAVCEVVERELLPSIVDHDPQHLIEIGMRAVIRDVQEWIDYNSDRAGRIDSKGLRAYLLAALITAGASEDPVAA